MNETRRVFAVVNKSLPHSLQAVSAIRSCERVMAIGHEYYRSRLGDPLIVESAIKAKADMF
jgi:hypothetical protein